jgi:anthranilate phosphoribosyltransferase
LALEAIDGTAGSVRDVLERLLAGRDLDRGTMEACFASLMAGEVPEPLQAALLVALRCKGETPDEVASAAAVLRRCAVPVATRRRPLVDTCGTGGDGAHTLNISTGAALVAAACGVAVAKHGNRSVSSRCGSADVLEALGVPIDLDAEQLGALLDDEGFAFLFAPRLHPAMRAVMPVRRALGVRTVFNLLGPLSNPAAVRRQVVGVYNPSVQELVAGALAALGSEHAWVVHSADGLDEISVFAPTRVVEVRDGRIAREATVEPRELGIATGVREEIAGGDAGESAARLEAILAGREFSAASEAVALNAGAALLVAGAVADLAEGLAKSRECLRRGDAAAKLDRVRSRAREMRA